MFLVVLYLFKKAQRMISSTIPSLITVIMNAVVVVFRQLVGSCSKRNEKKEERFKYGAV